MFDKNILLKNIIKSDDKPIYAKILDQAHYCLLKSEITFTDFLDPHKTSEILELLKSTRHSPKAVAFGGYQESERMVIGFSPDYLTVTRDDFPIVPIEIKYSAMFSKNLTHRDFLGSIIGLGIERKKIGDIILSKLSSDENNTSHGSRPSSPSSNGWATVFSYNDISEYICSNLERVSNTKVSAKVVTCGDFSHIENDLRQKRLTVSSLRIDTVISGIFNISRKDALAYINSERVFVNWAVIKNPSKILPAEANITIRGVGRAKFVGILGKSKKDKFIIDVLL